MIAPSVADRPRLASIRRAAPCSRDGPPPPQHDAHRRGAAHAVRPAPPTSTSTPAPARLPARGCAPPRCWCRWSSAASGLSLILTRRAALLKHHPGQVAFPGGKQDPADPSPLAAALREAGEEIGLAPGAVEILGALDPHETVTGFTVAPFVGLVAPGFRPAIDRCRGRRGLRGARSPSRFDPANFQVQGRVWQGRERRYYVLPYGPHYIWGATARILRALADRMQGP